VAALLRPEFVTAAERGLMVSHWYLLSDYTQLSGAIDKVMGRGDLKLVWELGRFSAEYAAQGIYKMFYKFGSPEWVIKMVASVWKQYYDVGRAGADFETIPTGKQIRFYIEAFPEGSPELWHSIGGWSQKSIEMSGGREVEANIAKTCKRPTSSCEIEIRWK
jgi:hypothetical protein